MLRHRLGTADQITLALGVASVPVRGERAAAVHLAAAHDADHALGHRTAFAAPVIGEVATTLCGEATG